VSRHPVRFLSVWERRIAAALLQLYNVAFLGAFWPFFTGIVFQIITAMFQFGRIILIPPE